MSFDAVKGQKPAADALAATLAKGRLPHGLLFLGPDGSGRWAMALELAKALFCAAPGAAGGCGDCTACRQAGKGFHPDLYLLEPSEEGARMIGVDAVRAMIGRAALKPISAPRKLFVVRGAERMNETAQNAFLKTLEEPQGFTTFVLCASAADALLPTLRSRLQTVRFLAPEGEPDPDAGLEALRRTLLDFTRALDSARLEGRDADPLASAPDLSKEDRQDLARALEWLAVWYRDALLVRAGAGEALAGREDLPDKERWAKRLDEEALLTRIELLSQAKERVAANVNVKLALASLWDAVSGRAPAVLRDPTHA